MPVELKTILDWASAAVAVLLGVIWKRHNQEIEEIKSSIKYVGENMKTSLATLDGRLDSVEKNYTPLQTYEQNRKEVREVNIQMFQRLDTLGQTLARIEGKLDK